MGEPGAASAETGLDLVDHEQHAALVAQPPHPGEILGGGRIHAALALDRLEEYRRDGRVDRRGERVEVFPRDVAESLRQRLERLVLRRLAGRVQRRERAPVERTVRTDDHVTAVPAEAPRQLERALVGLGTGVGEEHLATAAQQAVDRRCERTVVLVREQVRHVQQA